MKRCVRCDIVFNLEDRARCLYCNSLLMTIAPGEEEQYKNAVQDNEEEGAPVQEADEDMIIKAAKPAGEQASIKIGFASGGEEEAFIMRVIKDRRAVAYDRRYYIIGSYFNFRTLHFMYCFSRNEMKMGKTYRRALIQPLNMGSFLILPWVVFDVIDTVFVRLLYNGYCHQCGWKFKKSSPQQVHDPKECEYNHEYREIILDILSGQITRTEDKYIQLAEAKTKAGQRSAYRDLCSGRNFFTAVLDVVCVWFSISILILFLVMIVFPHLGVWINKADDVQPLELR